MKRRNIKRVTDTPEEFANTLRGSVLAAAPNDLIVYSECVSGLALAYQKEAARGIPEKLASMVQFPSGEVNKNGTRIWCYALQRRA